MHFSDLLHPRRYFALRAKRKTKARAFGMTSWHEQHWLRSYAAREYTGRGAIVDLGCFLGATTIALAEGLALNRKRKAKQIHAYDLFRWSKGFELWAKDKGLAGRFADGESFLPEFLNRTERWRDYISVHEQDLSNAQWDGESIELLLIDAMKTAEAATTITRAFFPHLIPGVGFVAHQDFAHAYTPWVHLAAYRLRDYFALAADVPSSGTTVFRCRREIPAFPTDLNLSFTAADENEIEAAFDYSLGLVPNEKKPNIVAAKAMAYRERGDLARAREVLASLPTGTASLANELEQITRLIAVHDDPTVTSPQSSPSGRGGRGSAR